MTRIIAGAALMLGAVTLSVPAFAQGAKQTIGVATVLVEERLVEVTEPVTTIRLDVPAGLIEARVLVVDGHARSVTIDNVASFAVALGERVNGIVHDIAYGGNFYAIADATQVGLRVAPDAAGELIAAGLELMAAVPEPVQPLDPEIRGCHHVIWTAPGEGPARSDGRGATAIHPGWVDRSPCGTGTSARMAALHARGELALDTPYVHESIIGTRFTGRLVGETTVGDRAAVLPQITGRAWITGRAEYVLDPTDPFPEGFVLD